MHYLSYRIAVEGGSPDGSALVADEVGLTERLIKADYAGKASTEEAKRYFALSPEAVSALTAGANSCSTG